ASSPAGPGGSSSTRTTRATPARDARGAGWPRSRSGRDARGVGVSGVPVAVHEFVVAPAAFAIALWHGRAALGSRRALGELLALTLDLAIEPVAIRRGLWHWTPPGPWLGVPVGNFVGWLVIVASYGLGAERWAGGGAFASEAARRLAVAAASLSALVAVGLVWTRLDLEQAVGRRGGWLFWAAVLLATAAVGVRRAPPFEGDTLSGRLASVPGPGPGLVFLVVATAFAAEAALLGARAVGLVE